MGGAGLIRQDACRCWAGPKMNEELRHFTTLWGSFSDWSGACAKGYNTVWWKEKWGIA